MTKQFIILSTFIVSFCSIVYELLLAQFLTVIFGSTVTQYALTIGIYMFFLGVGSLIFERLKNKSGTANKLLFIYIEILITLSAIFGMLFLIFVAGQINLLENILMWQLLSFVPIVVIAFLSGIELPLLTSMYSEKHFAKVLAWDYFGSLIGTVAYALFLYPAFGIFLTFIFVSSLNILIAIGVLLTYRNLHYRLFGYFLFFTFFVFIMNSSYISDALEKYYWRSNIIDVYNEYGMDDVAVFVREIFRTPYQTAIVYDIVFNKSKKYSEKDTCLNLDRHIQACGNWTEAYHHGLIDVPMSFLYKKDRLNILILGGGDFIPSSFLMKYQSKIENITIVDIDKQFQDFARTNAFLSRYNGKFSDDEKVKIYQEDAFFYVKHAAQANEKYDLVLIDLPGIKSDKLLHLYSFEFFKYIRNILSENGFAVSWYYPDFMYPTHNQVFMSTLNRAGFTSALTYVAYNGKDPANTQETERFIVLKSDNDFSNINLDKSSSEYVNLYFDKYIKEMRIIPVTSNARHNSILKPNYDIIVRAPERNQK